MRYSFFIFFLISCPVPGLRAEKYCDHLENGGELIDDPNQHDDDDADFLEKPCPDHDLDCVRKFFAKHTGCTPAHEPAHDPLLKTLEFTIPQANESMVLNNALLKGFNKGYINTFFMNKRADSLTLEVVFDSLQVDSLKTVLTYYRKGKEPLEASDFSNVDFRNLSLTLTIQHLHDKHAIKSHVFGYVSDPVPPLTIGPGLKCEVKGHTPSAQWKYKELIGLSAQEGMVIQARVYMDLFMKTKICDFKYGWH